LWTVTISANTVTRKAKYRIRAKEMNDFGFLYDLNANGKRIVTQSVSGTRMGPMLEHIAKTINEQERTYGKGKVSVTMLKARLTEETAIVDPKRMESLSALVTMAAEHYNKKAGKIVVETIYQKKDTTLMENLKKVLSNPKKVQKLVAELKLPDLDKGDVLMAGKWKNKKCVIDDFDTDDNGQPVAKTDRGDQQIFKPRVAKLMPGAQKDAPVEESHGSTAMKVRQAKEKTPENYCPNSKCLWRVKTRDGDKPCPKHMKPTMKEEEKQACENCGTEVGFVHRPGCTHLQGKQGKVGKVTFSDVVKLKGK
jgi:hypothetical protein